MKLSPGHGSRSRAESTIGTGGMTLVEVVVALTILAFIIGPLTMAFITGIRTTRSSEAKLTKTRAAQQIASLWTQDVQNVEPGGVNAESTCPSTEAETGIEEQIVTFNWGSDTGSGRDPGSASWVVTGIGANSTLVRRVCQEGSPVVEQTVAEEFGQSGKSASDLVHGPDASKPKVFCPLDADGVGRSCTIVVSGTYAYSLKVDRRVPDRTAAIVPPTVPGAPVVTGAESRHTRVNATWTAPAVGSGQPPITGYRMFVATSEEGEPVGSADSNDLEGSVSGLTNGTPYWVRVQAKNEIGWGPSSAPFGPVTPNPNTPEAPEIVSVSAGDHAVTITWRPDPNDGGSPVTGWHLYAKPTGAGSEHAEIVTDVTSVSGGLLRADLPNLWNGREYTMRLAGINTTGEGPDSGQSDAVTPYGVPGVAGGVTATPLASGDIRVSWTAPTVKPTNSDTVDGGRPIDGYRIRVASPANASVGPWPSASSLTASNATQLDVSGLSLGTSYSFIVETWNARGKSDSAPSSAVLSARPPSAPSVTAVTDGAGAVLVSWTAPAANGAPITSYQVTRDGAGGPDLHTSATVTPQRFTGLTSGQLYTFTVKAVNTAGVGAGGTATATATGLPSAPTSVSLSRPSGSFGRELTISYGAPTNTGGSTVTYLVRCAGSGSGVPAWQDVTFPSAGTYSVGAPFIKDGRDYTCQVGAQNAVGTTWSASSNATMPYGECTLGSDLTQHVKEGSGVQSTRTNFWVRQSTLFSNGEAGLIRFTWTNACSGRPFAMPSTAYVAQVEFSAYIEDARNRSNRLERLNSSWSTSTTWAGPSGTTVGSSWCASSSGWRSNGVNTGNLRDAVNQMLAGTNNNGFAIRDNGSGCGTTTDLASSVTYSGSSKAERPKLDMRFYSDGL